MSLSRRRSSQRREWCANSYFRSSRPESGVSAPFTPGGIEGRDYGFVVIGLDADEHVVDRSNERRVLRGLDLYVEITKQAPDLQAPGAKGFQM